MSLLRAELERFACRAVLWLVAGLLLLSALGFVIVAWGRSAPPSAAEVAAAREAYEADEARWLERQAEIFEYCRQEQELLRESGSEESLGCDMDTGLTWESYRPSAPPFEEVVPAALDGMTLPLLVTALAMGVSFVSAEFATGSMGTWLTFVPARAHVLGSKTAAAAIGVVPVLLVAVTTVLAGGTLVYGVRGLAQGDLSSWASMAGTAGRQVALAVLGAAAGAALAFMLRHAAAVTGVLVWWLLAVEVTLPVVVPALRPYTVVTNVRAWVERGATYTLEECRPDPTRPGRELCADVTHSVGAVQGGLMLVAVTATLVLIGLLVFRRRDVA